MSQTQTAVAEVSNLEFSPARALAGLVDRERPKTKQAAKKTETRLVGLDHEQNTIAAALEAGHPVLLIGEAATGKSSLVAEVARNTGRTLTRVNMDGGTTADEFLGRVQVRDRQTIWEDGILPQAMERGDLLLIDEVNAALPDCLFALHPVLERGGSLRLMTAGREVVPHPNFRVAATMNPTQGYAGTRTLNAALLSRFAVKIKVPALCGKKLIRALSAHVPNALNADVFQAAAWIEGVNKLRAEGTVTSLLTLREGIAFLELVAAGLENFRAVDVCLASALETWELEALKKSGAVEVPEKKLPEKPLAELVEALEKMVGLEAELAECRAELATMKDLRSVLAKLQTTVKL
jgi:MoxR-like ATPase